MQRRELMSLAALSLAGASLAGCTSPKNSVYAAEAAPQPEYVPFTLPVTVSEDLDKSVVAAADELRDLLNGIRVDPITAKGSMGCCLWIGSPQQCGAFGSILCSGYLAIIDTNSATLFATGTQSYLDGIARLKQLVRKGENGHGMLPLGLITNFPVVA